MIGCQSETFQFARVGVPRDRQELRIPSDGFHLAFQPTGARDGVEAQGNVLYKRRVPETIFVDVNERLHLVFLCREEEGFQIMNVVDCGMWHGVNGPKDVFPRLRGFIDIYLW